ncbi:MAG TPA: glycosyltransferase family 87 protein, partial [Gemmataceae bacterium]|nr:glycosyltransferase family 87 protein [Gemmataceae bacterium]
MDYARAPLNRWERASLIILALVIVGFGVLVEMRAAFLDRRMSDLTVFLRAGWAVRSGADIYQVSDESNGWYYIYPPFFAILMSPLGEAPPGTEQTGWPYPVTVAVWYAFNVFLLFWSIHRLAKAMQAVSDDPEVRDQPAWCRRWVYLRMLPIYACIVPIGSTLSHGQTNIIILAMLCGML